MVVRAFIYYSLVLFANAKRLDARDLWSHYHLGHTLRDLERVAEAIAVYERALALKPGFPEVETELALLRKAVLRKGP